MAHSVALGQGAALIFIVFGGYVVALNWIMVIESHRTGRHHSAIPLLGAVFFGAGLAILPRTRHYVWIAVLIDYGTLALLYALPKMVWDAWETSRYNLIAEYCGGQGIMTARISLYRRGIFTVRYDLKRPPGEVGMVGSGKIGAWSQEGQHLTLEVGDTSTHFDVITEAGTELLRQVDKSAWDINRELSLMGVDLLRQKPGGT